MKDDVFTSGLLSTESVAEAFTKLSLPGLTHLDESSFKCGNKRKRGTNKTENISRVFFFSFSNFL